MSDHAHSTEHGHGEHEGLTKKKYGRYLVFFY